MKVNMVKDVTQKIGHVVGKHSPTILTGLGVAGLVTTVVMAVKATPKAMQLLEEERDRREYESENGAIDPLTTIDVIKTAWKPYIPTAIMGAATIACIIGANTVNLRRNAAIAAAYNLSETALKEYQSKVIEKIGENKHREIKDEIAQDHVNKTDTDDKSIIITGGGDNLCLDRTSGRYFRSSIDKIKKAENEINHNLLTDMWITLNEIYVTLGLEPTSTGWDIGWDVNRDGLIDFNISACVATNGDPCLTLDFGVSPRPRY